MEQNEISEEVTVTPIIRDLERLFGRFVELIGQLIGLIFRGLAAFIKFGLKNFVILSIVVILGGLAGFFSTQFFPLQYSSSMVVKLNVDSKEQLLNDVGYINALIDKGAVTELGALLQLSNEEAQTLTGCEVYSYATYVEKTRALDELYRNTDTALYRSLNLEQLMVPSNSELSAKFKITFTATDQTVFSKIEAPLLAYLERVPELNTLLKSSQNALAFQRQIYLKEMAKLDTLAVVLNTALIERSKIPGQASSNTHITLGDEQQSSEINALDLQDRSIFYAQRISKIDVEIQEHETCYFVNSHLNPYGEKTGYGRLSRAIVVSLSVFGITYLILLIFKSTKKSV